MPIMFTGLVEALGEVVSLVEESPGVRLTIRSSLFDQTVQMGDSIALNGCCLTVVGIDLPTLQFQAGEETLKRTNLGKLRVGSKVNIERSLQAGARLGGHLVTGHIDGLATVRSRKDDGPWSYFYFDVPAELLVQIASKGSVAVDGVSLTVVDVDQRGFSVALIPHTLEVTTLGSRQVADQINLETDLLAKYVQRQVESFRGLLKS